MHIRVHLLAALCAAMAQACPEVRPSSDYAYLVGSLALAPGTPYRWLRNGQPWREGNAAELFLLHADEDFNASRGQTPTAAVGASLEAGRWGKALSGRLIFPREGNLDWREGTIEMWVAPRADGSDEVYAARDHVLFEYRAGADRMAIAQSRTAGVIYGGGAVNGQWESAYGGRASMRAWKAGEWHHLTFTFSASGNRMRFYMDGVLTADTNERRYWPPAATGEAFSVGGALAGPEAAFLVDEVRIRAREADAGEIRAAAARANAPREGEVWLPAADLEAGDSVALEAGGCASAAFRWLGLPVTGADPPSTLLPPGTDALDFSVRSAAPASCGYSVGAALELDAMTPFDEGQGETRHRTVVRGLSPDPNTVNSVYVRCSSEPGYALKTQYRSLPQARAGFPRKGNLWGSAGLAAKGLEYAARVDLYLGANFSAAEIRRLRELNPNILVLTSINTVENFGLPEDYYLHDTRGNRIEVWPGTYRLNLTKRHVAEYQARYAYQQMVDSGLMVDGCFFDNFFTTQSWLKADIHGNAVQIDADEDGKADEAKWLDAAWKAGVFHELETWRALMPHALASGHLPRPPQAEFAAIFNGDSIGFLTSDALEGKTAFQNLWDAYNNWFEMGRQPVIMMIESTPQDQISYGYDYSPVQKIPASTLEFARTYYPNVRFGLAFTLMNDGYFAHEFGDTWHGNDWWYDELDFNLGQPLGPAVREPAAVSQVSRIDNGGFEQPLEGTWRLTVNTSQGAAAAMARDTARAAEGGACARISVNASDGVDWHVDFNQPNRALVKGVAYDLIFRARADSERPISLATQKQAPDWRNYGLSRQVTLGTDWKEYTVAFTANETAQDSRVQFFVGARAGEVWIDDVRLVEHPPDVFRREFENGLVLLNGTRERRTVAVGPGYKRLKGEQAPRFQHIVDDDGPEFSATGGWRAASYDSGEWKSAGPFYHDWGAGCHRLDGRDGVAEWKLGIREDDSYTIEAWWPAAPGTWSKRAVYEVVAGGRVVATAAVDQSTGGDEWHEIARVPLAAAEAPVVRVRNEGDAPALADALHVRSARRYNDGAGAEVIVLEAMDGIVLERVK